MRHRCAILDDYQRIALTLADWSGVEKDADITVFTDPLGGTAGPEPVPSAWWRFAFASGIARS